MNREQAINQLYKGNKIKHRYFLDDEFVYLEYGQVHDEIGRKIGSTQEFFKHRAGDAFDKDWHVVGGQTFKPMEARYEEFRNNIMCRRDSNQHKAKKIWQEMKYKIPAPIWVNFETEWSHYMMEEFGTDAFGAMVGGLKKYFKEI